MSAGPDFRNFIRFAIQYSTLVFLAESDSAENNSLEVEKSIYLL